MNGKLRTVGGGFRRLMRQQGGFTLIELVAVMAILGILVAVVAPAVTNTQKAGVRAQARADSQQVRNAANDFFKDQVESEVTIPHSATVTADDDSGAIALTQQRVSTRWPEIFITEEGTPPQLREASTADSKYSEVFPTSTSASDGVVVKVTLDKDDGTPLSVDGAGGLLDDFTAIDLDILLDGGYLVSAPALGTRESDAGVGSLSVPNFLWLFQKTDASGSASNDAREIVVFELADIEQNEVSGADNTVNLSYEQIQ